MHSAHGPSGTKRKTSMTRVEDKRKRLTGSVLETEAQRIMLDSFRILSTSQLYLVFLMATLSKGFGFGIIAGSLLVKVLQILKILKSRSGEGISVDSVTLDLCAITIATSYGFVNKFPFSSWGNGAFLALQTAAIAFLILFYAGQTAKSFIYLVCYVIVCYILMYTTPIKTLWFQQGMNIPLLLTGKLTQAYASYKNRSTGQQSAATMFMLFFGSLPRIFTSIQETGDTMLVVTFCASTFANFVIVVQLIYYWNVNITKVKQEKKSR